MGQFFSLVLIGIQRLYSLVWVRLVVLYSVILAMTGWIVKLTEYAAENFEVLSPEVFTFSFSQVSTYLDLANHFFPVVETWALITATIPYIVSVLVFRAVKSIIPTISN